MCIRDRTKEDENESVAYVDIVTLFEGFNYKKELTTELQQIQSTQRASLDSLQIEHEVKAKSLESEISEEGKKKIEERLAYIEQQFVYKKKAFEKSNSALASDYDTKIRKQLNHYIEEYGKKNGYKFIYGVNGSGNLLYGDTAYNVTTQLIKYANTRYEGE